MIDADTTNLSANNKTDLQLQQNESVNLSTIENLVQENLVRSNLFSSFFASCSNLIFCAYEQVCNTTQWCVDKLFRCLCRTLNSETTIIVLVAAFFAPFFICLSLWWTLARFVLFKSQ